MNAIVRWCLARRSVVLLATVLIVLAGALGATQLRQQYFPPVDFPFLVVNTSAAGLSAQQIDERVTQPLERAVRSLEDIEGVQTIASEGQAQVFIQLAYGTDAAEMREDILAAMNEVPLPEEAEQLEAGGGFADQPIFNASISTSGDRLQLSRVAEDVRDEMETIEGVARVELAGGVTRRVQVELKRGPLEAGVNPTVLAAQIRSAVSNQPVGAVRSGGAVTPLVIEATTGQKLRDLRRLEIADGQRLSDVARVSLIANSGDSFARTNGRPAITLNVYRTDRADEVAITEAADQKLEPARKQLGAENVTTLFETGSDIKKSIRGLLLEGILGALFAVVVIFAFLRSARPTLVAAASIPTSIVFGLLAAWVLGLSLNIITLGGLTIAIGRVIDDAIVVLENIYKHLERGETRVQAAIRGTSEVSVAIGSSTIATAAVFLPIGLIGGFISEIFFSFSVIVVVALLASFVVAVTVIPV
ncbi:MAG: efflux RND transporter permease subunit, partial [Actinomycetota bacterium]|nr:efflux RND transporter permease subunit [Actinomycetota bacterium]